MVTLLSKKMHLNISVTYRDAGTWIMKKGCAKWGEIFHYGNFNPGAMFFKEFQKNETEESFNQDITNDVGLRFEKCSYCLDFFLIARIRLPTNILNLQ